VASLVVISLLGYPLSLPSKIIFVLAGLSDMIDGPLARRIENAPSELGAELDSMADMFMVIVAIFFIMPAMNLWPWLWPGILVALGFKLMSAVPGLIKHRKVFFLHTISNKILGFLLFSAAVLYFIFPEANFVSMYILFIIFAVFVITFEEMVIISTLDYPNKDIRGFWQVKQINEEYREKQLMDSQPQSV